MSAAHFAGNGVFINHKVADAGLVAAVLNHVDVGVCIVDGKLNVVAINNLAREILDFPADLIRPGLTLEVLIRYNATRGDFGEGNVEAMVRERLEVARTVEAESFEYEQVDGSRIEVKRSLLPDGGFMTTYKGNPVKRQTNTPDAKADQDQPKEAKATSVAAPSSSQTLHRVAQSAPEQPKSETGNLRGPIDILVAEDNEKNNKALSDILEDAGYNFRIARNGAEALSMYRSLAPNTMLINAALPRISGLEVAGAIRSGEADKKEHLPIIGMAAPADAVERETCIKAGMDYFLPLPIDPELLLATILRCLEDGSGSAQQDDTSTCDSKDSKLDAAHKGQPAGGAATRVLLAEDNQVNHEVFLELLEDGPYAVTGVWNGREAVVQYIANPAAFDVIMMDMSMPVMSGIEAVEAIRAHERIKGLSRIPIIGVSADTTDELREQALRAGVNRFLIKPVNVDQLLKNLTSCRVERQIDNLKETAQEMASANDANGSAPSLTIADLARKYQTG